MRKDEGIEEVPPGDWKLTDDGNVEFSSAIVRRAYFAFEDSLCAPAPVSLRLQADSELALLIGPGVVEGARATITLGAQEHVYKKQADAR